MVTREAVEAAAFWELAICLDCSATAEVDSGPCEVCGSALVWAAADVAAILARVEEDAGD